MSSLQRLKSRLAVLFSHAGACARQEAEVRQFQMGFLLRLGLERGHRFLDLDASSLVGGPALIEFLEPGHYIALLSEARAIERGRELVVRHGLERKAPRWVLASDPARVELPGEVDWVWGLGVLPTFDDQRLDDTLGLIARTLAPRGVVCVDAGPDAKGSHPHRPSSDACLPQRARLPQRERAERAMLPGRTFGDCCKAATRHGFTLRDLGTLSGLGHATGHPERDGHRMLLMQRAEG